MKVLKSLLEERDARLAELKEFEDGLVVEGQDEPRDLTPEEERSSLKLLKDIDALEERIRQETKTEKRNRRIAEARDLVKSDGDAATDVQVTGEKMVYGEGSPNSYYADLSRLTAGYGWGLDQDAAERMAQWAHQVEREVADDSQFGRDAVVQLRGMKGIRTENGAHARQVVENVRSRGRVALEQKDNTELRGIATGGGATASAAGGGGAALVTPVFFVQDTAPYREAGRAFIDQCNAQPLPEYGMNIYMPRVTGPAAVASQTEGSGVTETDPTLGYLSAGLITEAGQVTVTQQLLDRVGPNFQFDRLIFDQLKRDYNPKVDAYALTTALATAGAITFTSAGWVFVAAPGTASFVSKYAGAINAIETTAGTVMSPSHAFVQTSRWNFLESVGALESASGSLHPLFVPQSNGPFNAFATQGGDGFVPYEGNTGYKLLGLPVFKDLNIPTPGTGADQAIIANLREVYVYEGPTVTRAVPQTMANNLQILLQHYAYIAVLVRYPSAVQTISGTGMAAISF